MKKKPITFRGELFKSQSALAAHYGISVNNLLSRLGKDWTLEEAVGKPLNTGTKITFRGEPFESRAALATRYGINYGTLDTRLRLLGWTLEQALELEARPKQKPNRGTRVVCDGEAFDSQDVLAARYGIKGGNLRKRLKRGWTPEQAAGLDASKVRATIVVDGVEFPSIAAATRHYGIDYKRVFARLNSCGWTVDQAFGIDDPSDNRTGKKWMRRGNEQMRVRPDDVDKHLAQGWKHGRLFVSTETRRKQSKAGTGQKWMHQGNKRTKVRPADVDEKLAQGWVFGMLAKDT